MRIRTRVAIAVGLLGLGTIAPADNAALTSGGLPRMMSGHPTISMVSEVVKVVVHGKRVDTDCTFVFDNLGNACTVNMGFPDFGMWAYDYVHQKPKSIFKSFQSYVDGKRVATRLVLGADKREQWQTKLVSFEKDGSRVVREVYSTELGGAAASIDVGAASYVLHTGASWKGGIGKATVRFEFAPETEVVGPLDVKNISGMQKLTEKDLAHVLKPGGVIVVGPGNPTVHGASLVFEKSHWKPTTDDDILILFKYPSKVLQEDRKKAKELMKGSG